MITTTGERRRARVVAGALAAALLLSACGDGGEGAATTDGEEAAETTATEEDAPADGNDDAPEGGTEEGGTEEGGTEEAGEQAASAAPAEELTAEDGWNGDLHDLPLPGPGEGVLTIEGQTIDLEVTCDASGVLEDHGYLLFWFQATGQGEDADGRTVTASVSRQITTPEEAATSVYDYGGQERGQIQISVSVTEGWHSSIIVTPGDDDSGASLLPVVQVDEEGSFTVVEDVPKLHDTIHEDALSGPTELSGTCPTSWPEDAAI